MRFFTIRSVNIMLFLIQALSSLLSGCGTNSLPIYRPEPPEHSIGTNFEIEAKSKEKIQAEAERPKQDSLPSPCKGFEVSLFERPMRMEHKGLELASTSSLTLKSPQLTPDASLEERCEEIEKNFSGALSMYNGGMIRRMTLFVFKFKPIIIQESQIKNGESVYVDSSKVQIEFTDGQCYHLKKDVSVNCEHSFELKC